MKRIVGGSYEVAQMIPLGISVLMMKVVVNPSEVETTMEAPQPMLVTNTKSPEVQEEQPTEKEVE